MKRYSVVQRHKSRGIRTWYGRIFDMDDGSVQYVSLGVEKKKEALAWRDRMITEQMTGSSGKGASVSVETAIESFMKSSDVSEWTATNYRSALSAMGAWLTDNKIRVLGDMTNLAASSFISSLDGWKASTKRKRLTIYRTWAKWCMEMYEPGWKKNPFSSVKVKGEKSVPRDFWTVEQVEAIIAAAPDPLQKLMYAFMAFAGLRFSEFNSLRLCDIFEEDGTVKKRLRICGKGGKVAFVPICTRLREQILSTYTTPQNTTTQKTTTPKNSQFLGAAKGLNSHILYSNNKKQNRLLKRVFSKNSNLASFGGTVHLHRFRHSFISNLIRANKCSIRCVAELARHENVNITLRYYAHLLPSDMDEALEIFTRQQNQDNQGGS